MERLRLALFTDTFDETNGVAHTYRTLAEFCRTTGRRLDVFAPGTTDSEEQDGSLKVHRFSRGLGLEYYDDLHFSVVPNWRVQQVFEEHGPYDLVQVAAPGNLGGWGRRLARKRGLPLIGVHHTMLQDYAAMRVPWFLSGLVRSGSLEILRRFYRPCQTVLAPTPKLAEFVRRVGISKQSDVFSRGVDTARFSPEHRTRQQTDPVRLLYVGRLAVEKNLEALSRILKQVKAKRDCEMVFVGDGPLKNQLERDLPWARFEGRKKGEALSEAYANGDVFVFPSLTDTFGNVVNEAQASGVPCMVMDPRGPGEIITPERTGLLAQSEEAFAEGIINLIDVPQRRLAMSEAARSEAMGRSWERVFDSLWEVYGRVAKLKA